MTGFSLILIINAAYTALPIDMRQYDIVPAE